MLSFAEVEKRIVRYGELVPCRTAFIDAHTPGSNQKENFTIIGAGVSESPDQHVHIKESPGFNIGAAGQPPKCRNSLHSHTTAEVFYVLKGRWRFFWGRTGDAGEVMLEEGDIFSIPTGVFRGFENVGTDYGMIMAVLGGNDAGGGVTWAPQVIEEAQGYGLILGENGRLYDSKKGEHLPQNIKPMSLLNEEELKNFPETSAKDVVSQSVARYWDMMAYAKGQPANVIGKGGMIDEEPGFEVDFISHNSAITTPYVTDKYEVFMIMRGHWRMDCQNGQTLLGPGDTCALIPGINVSLEPSMSGESSLFRVRSSI